MTVAIRYCFLIINHLIWGKKKTFSRLVNIIHCCCVWGVLGQTTGTYFGIVTQTVPEGSLQVLKQGLTQESYLHWHRGPTAGLSGLRPDRNRMKHFTLSPVVKNTKMLSMLQQPLGCFKILFLL